MAWSGSGSGTEQDPYQIDTLARLQEAGSYLSSYFVLTNDIDATATSGWNSGQGFVPIGNNTNKFTGNFDGLNHTITGLYINRPSTNYQGLFGYTDHATIKNVGLIECSVSGNSNIGGLIGRADYSTITNCYSTGFVNGDWCMGGLISYSSNSTITNCYSTCSVSGTSYVGGLIGYANNSTTTNCYSTGSVSGGGYVGGLISGKSGGSVNNSFWDTETSGQSSSAGGTGKTTAQMKTQATFTNWDFASVWFMSDTLTYPKLRSLQYPKKLVWHRKGG